MAGYQTKKAPRFHREAAPGGYEFRVPASKNWFVILFLCFWLTGWTMGGAAAMFAATTQGEPFIYLWLVFWAAAWFFAVIQLLYMLTGYEFIRCSGGDLEIGFRAILLNRSWKFRGSEITSLAAADSPNWFGNMAWSGWSYPILGMRLRGAIRFNHGARTFYAGNGLDHAEAELIVADLLKSMPNAA